MAVKFLRSIGAKSGRKIHRAKRRMTARGWVDAVWCGAVDKAALSTPVAAIQPTDVLCWRCFPDGDTERERQAAARLQEIERMGRQ